VFSRAQPRDHGLEHDPGSIEPLFLRSAGRDTDDGESKRAGAQIDNLIDSVPDCLGDIQGPGRFAEGGGDDRMHDVGDAALGEPARFGRDGATNFERSMAAQFALDHLASRRPKSAVGTGAEHAAHVTGRNQHLDWLINEFADTDAERGPAEPNVTGLG